MKILKRFVLGFALIVFSFACHKDKDVNPVKTLSQHEFWKLDHTSLNGEISNASQFTETYSFYADQTFDYHTNSAYIQASWGEWVIDKDTLRLNHHYNEQDPQAYYEMAFIIYELSNTTLTLGHRFESNGQMNSLKSIFKPY